MLEKLLEIVKFFPMNLSNILYNTIISNNKIKDELQEIRIRVDRPLILKLRNSEIIVEYKITQNDILQIVERLCENSIYAYKKQICEGYITIKGGNRVGIVGSGVIENGQVININYISSLNFRISRQKIGCSNQIVADIINFENKNSLTLGLVESIAGGYICTENEKASTQLAAIKDILKKKSSIESAVSYAEKQFAPYSDYI